MTKSRGWLAAVLGTAAMLVILLVLVDTSPVDFIGGIAATVLLVVGWLAFRRRAATHLPSALALTVTLVVACGAGTAFEGFFAVAQCVAFPLLWTTWPTVRSAIYANIALAAAVGIGYVIDGGTGAASLERAAVTVAISLGFSIALGLWFSRIYDLVAERDRLIGELRQAQDLVAGLSRDAGMLDERERLAREIHDTIAQDLTGMVLTAQRGLRELRSGDAPAAAEQLSILEDNARSALAETRGLVAAGAPAGIEGGLTTALGRLGERFERETGVTVTVRAPGTADLDRDSEVVLLRCAQEALANVRKHSGATAASVTVSTTHDSVVLRVSDNGTGFDTGPAPSGFGLNGMRDRLALANGSLSIVSTPGHGAAVIATLPGLRTVVA